MGRATLDEPRRTHTGGTLAAELRPTLALAAPVVLAELGWMGMGVADLFMVGRLGAEAIAAAGIGNILFFTVAIVAYGVLLGLDTMVSQAFGAGKLAECHRSGLQGVYFTLASTPILMAGVELLLRSLGSWGIERAVVVAAVPFVRALNWGLLPLMLFTALRRYLQGMGLVRVATFAMISANVVNIAGNWVLVYGHLGAPALGVEGSGWATFVARAYMAAVLIIYAIWYDRRHDTGLFRVSWRPDWGLLRRLLALGLPTAVQLELEVGVFSLAAALAGRLGATSLAAHEIALHAAATTFMVPMGVSSAGAVRVGHAVGRGDPEGAARAGWAALVLGGGFMALAALTFWLLPGTLLGAFSADARVLSVGMTLLFIAGFFQLFDGVQVVASGNLRGLGETRIPMYTNLLAHWSIGLPIGYVLAFPLGWGVAGLWVGLSTGLIVAGLILLAAWSRKSRRLAASA